MRYPIKLSGMAPDYHNELITQAERRLLEESFPRLRQCLARLNDDQLWRRPGKVCSSPGNLARHLCGNINQWLNHTLNPLTPTDTRQRDAEFDPENRCPRHELLQLISDTEARTAATLRALADEMPDLTQFHRVQGFNESGIAILIHVVEHFSYHVGQVTQITKMWTEQETGYYDGFDLNQT